MMKIHKPTLLLNTARAIRNIERMIEKARKSRVRFRPHFKTHQSGIVGDWFRQRGVGCITVSSLDMAWYFAQYGWKDILVAFPVNVLEIEKINALAADIHLHLLVESLETVFFLEEHLTEFGQAHIWIKIDTGYHRTGLEWHHFDHIIELARHISQAERLHFQGILTHSGQTYHARSKGEIQAMHTEAVSSMRAVQGQLGAEGFEQVEISIGDTPSCSVVNNLSEVDEIRPGNFVFYDVMQFMIGACAEEDIAVAVACPVVAKHVERSELVIYGGAVHLSKERASITLEQGQETAMYGYLASPILKHDEGLEPEGWGNFLEQTYVSRISQEHGIITTTEDILRQVNIGDVVLVVPVHSCLTANLLRKYVTLEGEIIPLGAFT